MKEYSNHLKNHTTTPSGALIEKCHKIFIELTKSKALDPRLLQFKKFQLWSHIDALTKLWETVEMTKLETSIISQLQEIIDLYFCEPEEWIWTLPIPPKPLTRDYMSTKDWEIIRSDPMYMELDTRYTELQDYYYNNKNNEEEIISDLQKCAQDIKDVFRNSALRKVTRDIEQLWDDNSKIDKFDNDWKNPISIRQNFSPINDSTMGITKQPTTFDGGNNDQETSLPKEEDLSYLDCCDVWDDSRHVLRTCP